MLTSKEHLKALYSAQPKIIIASSEVKKLNLLNQTSGVKFYQYKKNETGEILTPIEEEKEEELIEITLAPIFVLGFLINSHLARHELEPLKKWWSERANQEQIPSYLELINQENSEALKSEFWQLIFHKVSQENINIAQRLAKLQRQYLQLRSLYENTQNAFGAIEAFLSQAKLPPLQLAFENASSHEMLAPKPTQNPYQIKQLLPLPGTGLATIDIQIAKVYPHSMGRLKVSVVQIDDDTFLAQWSIPYQNLSEGWLSLDLPSIAVMPKNDIELRIEWGTNIGPAPAMFLGELQPVPQFRTYAHSNYLNRSLAFRLWTGLPGSRKVVSPYSLSLQQDETKTKPVQHLGYLGQASLSKIIEITPNLPTESFKHIFLNQDFNKILTHPRDEGLTMAMLPFSFPLGATHLTATVATENAKANVIEYGMALIDEGMNPKTCCQENAPDLSLAFSGWIKVKPLEDRQIKLAVQPSANKYYHIVIATKVPQGSSSKLGWAYWLNFFVESNPELLGEIIPEVKLEAQPQFIPEVDPKLNLKLKLDTLP
jgi:hypothetical protein